MRPLPNREDSSSGLPQFVSPKGDGTSPTKRPTIESQEQSIMPANGIPSWVLILAILLMLSTTYWAWLLVKSLQSRRFLREIQSRPDHSARWSAEFPNDMTTIDQILTVFCYAFMFDQEHKFHLTPEDNVAAFYRNTTGPIGDELRYEELILGIERVFDLEIKECAWDENLSLGELARTVLESKKRGRCGPSS